MWAHLATALANEQGLAGYEVHEVRSKESGSVCELPTRSHGYEVTSEPCNKAATR